MLTVTCRNENEENFKLNQNFVFVRIVLLFRSTLFIYFLCFVFKMPTKCCVPGCTGDEDNTSKLFAFPIKTGLMMEAVRKIWCDRIGDEALASIDLKKHPKKICRKHFIDECISSNGRLMRNALPTKFLPDFDGEANIENSFLHHLIEDDDDVPAQKEDELQTSSESSLLEPSPTKLKVKTPQKTYRGKATSERKTPSNPKKSDCTSKRSLLFDEGKDFGPSTSATPSTSASQRPAEFDKTALSNHHFFNNHNKFDFENLKILDSESNF